MTEIEKEEIKEMMKMVCQETMQSFFDTPNVEENQEGKVEESTEPQDNDVEVESDLPGEGDVEEKQENISLWKAPKLIGVTGAKAGIGTTHTALIVAKTLFSEGKNAALIDMSESGDLSALKEEEKEELHVIEDGDLIDLDKASYQYDVIILDLGRYSDEIKKVFGRCDKKIIVSRGAPWEMHHLQQFFEDSEKESYYFLFNSIVDEKKESIEAGMKPLKVSFLPYMPDPFDMAYPEILEELFDEGGNKDDAEKAERR